jgi:hypothetical protein
MLDRNPKANQDKAKRESALKVADMLWDNSQGNFKKVPDSYLDSLDFMYSDGYACLLGLLNKVDLDAYASYEEYREVAEELVRVDPEKWPDLSTIEEIKSARLLDDTFSDFAEFEDNFDFADPDDMAAKMDTFIKKTIASVYTDGVSYVQDEEGNPPSEANNYLMSEDGKTFSGVFGERNEGEEDKVYRFNITEKDGKWSITY